MSARARELVRFIAVILLLSAAFTVGLLLPHPSRAELDRPTTVTCLEDEPCWDCTSMGNQKCGR